MYRLILLSYGGIALTIACAMNNFVWQALMFLLATILILILIYNGRKK